MRSSNSTAIAGSASSRTMLQNPLPLRLYLGHPSLPPPPMPPSRQQLPQTPAGCDLARQEGVDLEKRLGSIGLNRIALSMLIGVSLFLEYAFETTDWSGRRIVIGLLADLDWSCWSRAISRPAGNARFFLFAQSVAALARLYLSLWRVSVYHLFLLLGGILWRMAIVDRNVLSRFS